MSDVVHGGHVRSGHVPVRETATAADQQDKFRARTLALAILFAMGVSAGAGLILLALRLPAGESALSIGALHLVRGFGLMLAFILSTALMIERKARPWAIALVPVGLLVLLVQGGAMAPFPADIFLGLVLVLLLISAHRRGLLFDRRLPAVLILGLALSVVNMAALVLKGYSHPLAFENALLGVQHKDTLFHAAIAGSLQHLNIASIGLDGTVSLHYHTLSHRLIGAFATWSGLPDLMSYSLFVPVIGIPVFLFLMLASLAVSRRQVDLRADPFVGFTALLALILLVNAVTQMSVWFSESFVIGLWLMALALLVMARCGAGKADVLTGLSLALLVLLASQAKISVGAVLAAGVCIWLTLAGGIRGLLMAVLFGAAPFLFVYVSSFADAAAGGESMFGPLYFYRRFPETLLAIAMLGYVIYRLHRSDRAQEGDTLIFRLSIAGMLASAFLCGLVLKLPGVAESYFVSPGLWAALLYVGSEGILSFWSPKRGLTSRSATAMATAVLAVLVAAMVLTKMKPLRILKGYRHTIETLAQASAGEGTQGLLARTAFGRIVARVEADPEIDAVQVDPQVRDVWDGHKPCWAASLVIPATTRRPMLAGLPPARDKCELTPFYGFADYRSELSSARTFDEATLCEKAETLSLKRILRVGPEGMTILNCETRTE